MRIRIALCAACVLVPHLSLAADDPELKDLLKSGDRFLTKLPDLLKDSQREEFYEASALGKRIGVMRVSTSVGDDPNMIEYRANAILRTPDNLTVLGEAVISLDKFGSLHAADLHQTARRADGKGVERQIEIARKKSFFEIRTTQGKKSSKKTIEAPDGRCVTLTPALVAAVVSSGEKKLAFRDFDPEEQSVFVRILEVNKSADGKAKVNVTKAGESTPSESYVIGKSGRMLNFSKGLAESLRRVKKAEYEKQLKELESKKAEGDDED